MQEHSQIKTEAEALRLALITGLVAAPEVIRWVDDLIGRIDELPAEILDVSLARDGNLNEVAAALSCIPGVAHSEDVAIRVFTRMLSTLAASASNLSKVTRALEHMAIENVAPSPHAQSIMYGFYDALDLARRGTYGTVENVLERVLAFLREHGRSVRVDVREWDPPRDRAAVRSCFVELQDFERELEPGMRPGEEIADAYLDLMLRRCREFDGVVLVAEQGGAVVGFLTLLRRFRSSEPDDDPREHAYVTDLVVAAPHRKRGIGRSLLRAAEAHARSAGAHVIRLSVKAGNAGARALYAAEGFGESELVLEKHLR
jgi:ribosomal protein S18 acetylase RimI-like enzyme